MVELSNVLTVNTNVIDAHTMKEFLEKFRAGPGKYNYASTGNGTGTHLAFAEFVSRAGLDMVHVPYKGGPEALTSVVSGTTCCIFNQVQTVLPQWKAGRVRLLGVTTRTRVSAIPEVPTIAEAGVPGYESYTWFGLFGPKGIDADILAKVNAAGKFALEQPAGRWRVLDLRANAPLEDRQRVRAPRTTRR